MKTTPSHLVAIGLMLLVVRASAMVLYVDLSCTNSSPPFAGWSTAATNIQDAIDAAADGDLVLVTNGIYQAGGRVVYGALTNRVAVTKALTLQSVNGPGVTFIQGNATIGDNAVRCVYLTNGAALRGFTLTGGATRSAGAPSQEMSGGGVWCESTNALLSNCVLQANAAANVGGGVWQGTLHGCILVSNTTTFAWWSGGGAGAQASVLNNCLLYGNAANGSGGAAANCTLNNCTVVNNSTASWTGGGGAYACRLNNCIVFFNGDNYGASTLINCCTTPDPSFEESNDGTAGDGDNGVNNIIADPLFVDAAHNDFHLRSDSPCINMGTNAYAPAGADLDGNARIIGGTVDIGAYEFQTPIPMTVAIQAEETNTVVGFPLSFVGLTRFGWATASRWDFGDGVVVSNQMSVSHSWLLPGDFPVVFTGFNDANPSGASATVMVHIVSQSIHYVSQTSLNPVAPYTSWDTAATSIQDAVDAAYVGGTVLVSNGVYQTGGRVVSGALTNRVVVTRPLLVTSLNGPAFTTIQGNSAMGDSAVRCLYLTNRAMVAGFTLSGGATRTFSYVDSEQCGGGVWCGDAGIIVSNCVLTGNSAVSGGGAYQGLLLNCSLVANAASGSGGGAMAATLNNCALVDNAASGSGGGVESCTLNQCTLSFNSAYGSGGGAGNSALTNCIVYYNTASDQPNYFESTLSFCCTTPLPPNPGNLTNAPQLLDYAHIAPNSPCIGAGATNAAIGKDMDGEAWLNPPSIGCDEYQPGASGNLAVSIRAEQTNAVRDFSLHFSALVLGHASSNAWSFGDGTGEANAIQVSHRWTLPGDYAVVLQAFNDEHPGGISATVTVHVVTELIWHVDPGCAHPVPPYLSWDTAATNIADALTVASSMPNSFILVTNGTYAPLSVGKPVEIRSVNGAAVTLIDGGGAQRCVYLAAGATLTGFTLTNGWDYVGAGAYCESPTAVLSNCVLTGNAVIDSGGGAYQGTLNNCVLSQNSATYAYFPPWGYDGSGGGALNSLLNNCTLAGNRAYRGGGAFNCTLNHCTLEGNSALGADVSDTGEGGGMCYGTASYCTLSGNTALYGGGESYAVLNNCVLRAGWARVGGGDYYGTLSNSTLAGNGATDGGGTCGGAFYNCILYYNSASFGDANYLGGSFDHCCTTPDPRGIGNITWEPLLADLANGDYHLQSNSPCINAGNNAQVSGTNDWDGHPRIAGGTVDIGACEFQTPSSILSYAWAQQYGVPTDGSADYADPDHDGMSNWQEWIAGTIPTNAASVLRLAPPVCSPRAVLLRWDSVTNHTYFIERSTNLGPAGAFALLQTNISGLSGTTTYTDTNAPACGSAFYRVGVQP